MIVKDRRCIDDDDVVKGAQSFEDRDDCLGGHLVFAGGENRGGEHTQPALVAQQHRFQKFVGKVVDPPHHVENRARRVELEEKGNVSKLEIRVHDDDPVRTALERQSHRQVGGGDGLPRSALARHDGNDPTTAG